MSEPTRAPDAATESESVEQASPGGSSMVPARASLEPGVATPPAAPGSAASGREMTPAEIELAEFFGPPDFLLAAEQFDAENGSGSAAELLRIAKENSCGHTG